MHIKQNCATGTRDKLDIKSRITKLDTEWYAHQGTLCGSSGPDPAMVISSLSNRIQLEFTTTSTSGNATNDEQQQKEHQFTGFSVDYFVGKLTRARVLPSGKSTVETHFKILESSTIYINLYS